MWLDKIEDESDANREARMKQSRWLKSSEHDPHPRHATHQSRTEGKSADNVLLRISTYTFISSKIRWQAT